MSAAIIIQARMGSVRFPGKVLAPLLGKPVIEHVVDRALDAARGTDIRVAVAIPDGAEDVPLDSFLRERYDNVASYIGLEHNVLHRFYQTACAMSRPDYIVRLTGDCPLVDPRLIRECLDEAATRREPYYGQTNSPDGTDVEAFSFAALHDAYTNAPGDQAEHVTTWIRRNRKGVSHDSDPKYADVHYSVNTIDDLHTCQRILLSCTEGARWQDHVAAYRRIHGQANV